MRFTGYRQGGCLRPITKKGVFSSALTFRLFAFTHLLVRLRRAWSKPWSLCSIRSFCMRGAALLVVCIAGKPPPSQRVHCHACVVCRGGFAKHVSWERPLLHLLGQIKLFQYRKGAAGIANTAAVSFVIVCPADGAKASTVFFAEQPRGQCHQRSFLQGRLQVQFIAKIGIDLFFLIFFAGKPFGKWNLHRQRGWLCAARTRTMHSQAQRPCDEDHTVAQRQAFTLKTGGELKRIFTSQIQSHFTGYRQCPIRHMQLAHPYFHGSIPFCNINGLYSARRPFVKV